MKLPVFNIRMLPNLRCTRCGQKGYVSDRAMLCGSCWNISLLRYAKRKAEEERQKKLCDSQNKGGE